MAPVIQTLPWPVRVRRWWRSPTHVALVTGAMMNAAAGAVDGLHYINLDASALVIALVLGNVALHLLGATLNYFTTTIIGNADEVAKTGGAATGTAKTEPPDGART